MAHITTTIEGLGIEKGLQKGLQEGIQKGREEGLQEGMQKGLKQGLLEAISLGLELKFGKEGLQLYNQISLIDSIEQLEKIKEAIRAATSPKDIEKLALE